MESTYDPPVLQRPLRVWAVSEQKIGTLSQCLGVGRYFDPTPLEKIIVPRHGLKRLLAPPIFRRSEPEPDILISCGYRPEKPVLKAKRAFGNRPIAIHLQRPEIEGYDCIFVSRHDWTDELSSRSNYFPMVGVPHRLSPHVIEERRPSARATYSPDDSKVAGVFVGGANGAYEYDQSALNSIVGAVTHLQEQGWRVLVSTSRRSSEATLEQLLRLRSDRVQVWDGALPNPYLDFVAAADAYLIAKDSITMPCEALASGKPVYSLDLTKIQGPRLEKFERFHSDLQQTLRLTRPFEGSLEPYDYEPLNEAARLSAIIRDEMSLPAR